MQVNAPSETEAIKIPAVSVIPATRCSARGGEHMEGQKDLRVSAYCRVSTGEESQQTSYTNQKAFYTEYINSHAGWQFGGIYADEALSGTSRIHRREFNRMIEDAKAGQIDYIVTKSISRFARNTVDTLNCVRELRLLDPPVGIYFEKENIDTLDAAGELILTILSALAQDESRSISDNIRWTFQKKFAAGIPQINLNRMLGYDKGENGEWMINEQQAVIVRFIFRKYVRGHSANSIAKQANELGYRTVNDHAWTAGAVLDILRNEKFVGDLEMQKTITKDFLTHKTSKNNGEAPKYYVKDHHVGIIDRFTWDKTQMILNGGKEKTAKEKPKKGQKSSVLANLICGEIKDGKICGEPLHRMTYSGTANGYTDERSRGFDPETETEKYSFHYPVWRCKGKKGNAKNCPSSLVQECAVEQSFMELLYWLKRDQEANGDNSWLAKEFQRARDTACKRLGNNRYSFRRMEILDGQIQELEDNLRKVIGSRTEIMKEPDPAEDLRSQIEDYKKERAALEKEQGVITVMSRNYRFFLRCLKELPEVNYGGMKMNINGLDVDGSMFRDMNGRAKAGVKSCVRKGSMEVTAGQIAGAPDYLRFEKGIYGAFIQRGCVKGDAVEYTTNFGVKITSYGNSRTLGSFLGFRRCREDGTVELLDEIWKVNGKTLTYIRKQRKRSR